MSDRQVPWFDPRVSSIKEAILFALSYADIYDYPLTLSQIHRYLVGIRASMHEISQIVNDTIWARQNLAKRGAYYMLPERENLAALRQYRTGIAHNMWIRARYYANLIARIPFVRMVALTGALTMDNVKLGDDYDYLIVAECDHLWLSRFLIIQLIVKPALRRGEEVCPNYIVTERALVINEIERDLYNAHELTQMVPLFGKSLYNRLRVANKWTNRFLPNATEPPTASHFLNVRSDRHHRLYEGMLKATTNKWFEKHELSRMVRKLHEEGSNDEVTLSLDQCKGHIGENRKSTRIAFEERIKSLKGV